ncbi:hypothetical protein GCM10010294_24980 [Streptomyces griseoloalbus]|uniref:hypothetical protein n=1 Tax=Streptomyces griseoloalbus TaxID=67303 RepID=UPI001873A0FC|nr:hypothetical protein GCM10010294_24980 [Streptomyces griseoloalbus]
MPKYERRGDDHEVAETVITVEGSPRDQQLAASKEWKRVEDSEQQTASAAEPTPQATAKAKPPVKEA